MRPVLTQPRPPGRAFQAAFQAALLELSQVAPRRLKFLYMARPVFWSSDLRTAAPPRSTPNNSNPGQTRSSQELTHARTQRRRALVESSRIHGTGQAACTRQTRTRGANTPWMRRCRASSLRPAPHTSQSGTRPPADNHRCRRCARATSAIMAQASTGPAKTRLLVHALKVPLASACTQGP